jgi:hypothetical protein
VLPGHAPRTGHAADPAPHGPQPQPTRRRSTSAGRRGHAAAADPDIYQPLVTALYGCAHQYVPLPTQAASHLASLGLLGANFTTRNSTPATTTVCFDSGMNGLGWIHIILRMESIHLVFGCIFDFGTAPTHFVFG